MFYVCVDVDVFFWVMNAELKLIWMQWLKYRFKGFIIPNLRAEVIGYDMTSLWFIRAAAIWLLSDHCDVKRVVIR